MSDKTTYKQETAHGYNTPHKYPSTLANELDTFNDLSVQLYPTGRAWYKPIGGVFDNLHISLNRSFARFLQDEKLLLDSTFPDNTNFNVNDAKLWEYRLGLITNESLTLDIRRNSVKRKLGYPNNIKARQHGSFIESQLRMAGFDVWVFENTIPYRRPEDIALIVLGDVQHGEPTQHGNGVFHGGNSYSVIANSINEIEPYAIGGDSNLWATFFICGENLGETASVSSSRLREFKELVIKLKPAHTVAFTFINYN